MRTSEFRISSKQPALNDKGGGKRSIETLFSLTKIQMGHPLICQNHILCYIHGLPVQKAREANNDLRMELLTGPDENSDLSKDEDHKMKLFTKQSEVLTRWRKEVKKERLP